jgi:hypothetical protein
MLGRTQAARIPIHSRNAHCRRRARDDDGPGAPLRMTAGPSVGLCVGRTGPCVLQFRVSRLPSGRTILPDWPSSESTYCSVWVCVLEAASSCVQPVWTRDGCHMFAYISRRCLRRSRDLPGPSPPGCKVGIVAAARERPGRRVCVCPMRVMPVIPPCGPALHVVISGRGAQLELSPLRRRSHGRRARLAALCVVQPHAWECFLFVIHMWSLGRLNGWTDADTTFADKVRCLRVAEK